MSVCVGIGVHRKRSQVAVIDQGGEVLANRNVPNGVEPILRVIGGLPSGTPAAFEAAFGWGWLVELLEGYGFEPHLVHPLQCKAIASARLKNDKVDAAILAQLLRADLLPEAWIAPPAVRQLPAPLRHRWQRGLESWAGLTRTVRGSDRAVRQGHISRQGSVWVRWVLCEAAQTAKRHPDFAASYQAIAARRGKKIATTAIARKLLTRACHLLTDASSAGEPQ